MGITPPSQGMRAESSIGTAGSGVWSNDRLIEQSPGRMSPPNDGKTINLEQGVLCYPYF